MKFNRPQDWFVETRSTHNFPSTWEGWLIFGLILLGPFVAMFLGLGG